MSLVRGCVIPYIRTEHDLITKVQKTSFYYFGSVRELSTYDFLINSAIISHKISHCTTIFIKIYIFI